MQHPTVQLEYSRVTLEADASVGAAALPTLTNSVKSIIKVPPARPPVPSAPPTPLLERGGDLHVPIQCLRLWMPSRASCEIFWPPQLLSQNKCHS